MMKNLVVSRMYSYFATGNQFIFHHETFTKTQFIASLDVSRGINGAHSRGFGGQ